MTGRRVLHSSDLSTWRTPAALAEALWRTFDITIDLAANARSSLCGKAHFGPGSQLARDAIAVSWHETAHSTGFLNPPFSLKQLRALRRKGYALDHPYVRCLRLEAWAEKAYDESRRGFTTIGLFPYAPQTDWFRRYVMGHELVDGQEFDGEPDRPHVSWARATRRSTTGGSPIA